LDGLHGVVYQKTELFISTAVRTSNHTSKQLTPPRGVPNSKLIFTKLANKCAAYSLCSYYYKYFSGIPT
jgi:hypothetical protein